MLPARGAPSSRKNILKRCGITTQLKNEAFCRYLLQSYTLKIFSIFLTKRTTASTFRATERYPVGVFE